jgi:hypothetical protein
MYPKFLFLSRQIAVDCHFAVGRFAEARPSTILARPRWVGPVAGPRAQKSASFPAASIFPLQSVRNARKTIYGKSFYTTCERKRCDRKTKFDQ